ncbi:MAG: DUF3465 domain-containing protein [Candidatus Eremiobacteraeota bacterium]|nr:DUF3465 domain-containing protein [Candidatus Eremiobacteraeota bacterium]
MHKLALCALLFGCAGCASAPPNVAAAVSACARGASHVEVADRGTIARVLGVRRSYSGLHEGFIVQFPSAVVRVEDNADITGTIPLHRGEPLALQGQYECNDGVIHWTHHDPSFRHQPGYVEAGGKRYQ